MSSRLLVPVLIIVLVAALAFFTLVRPGPVVQADEDGGENGYEAPSPEDVRYIYFRHLFIGTFDSVTEAEKSAKQAKAEAALAALKAGGDFETVAREFSEVPRTEAHRGVRQTKQPGEINPKLEAALLALRPGTYSGIIPTDYGFEILYLEDLAMVPIPPTPAPTPTPMFEKRLAAAAIPAHAFRPLNSEIPYRMEDGFVWTTVKSATFYAPIQFPDGAEISGFCVWLRDAGGEERPVSRLLFYNFYEMSGKHDVIATRVSDGPWPPEQFSMSHYPGCKYEVNNSYGGFVMEVVLNSGDQRQAIRGGMAIYTMSNPPGHKMGQFEIDYIAEVQSHPGTCPVCIVRERNQRLRALQELEKLKGVGVDVEGIAAGTSVIEIDYVPEDWTPSDQRSGDAPERDVIPLYGPGFQSLVE